MMFNSKQYINNLKCFKIHFFGCTVKTNKGLKPASKVTKKEVNQLLVHSVYDPEFKQWYSADTYSVD